MSREGERELGEEGEGGSLKNELDFGDAANGSRSWLAVE